MSRQFGRRGSLSRVEDWKSLILVRDPVELVLKFKMCEPSAVGFLCWISTYDEFFVVFEFLAVILNTSYENHALSVVKIVFTTELMQKLTRLFDDGVLVWFGRGLNNVSTLCQNMKRCCWTVRKNMKQFEGDDFRATFDAFVESVIRFLELLNDKIVAMGMGSEMNFEDLLKDFGQMKNEEPSEGASGGMICFYPTNLFLENSTIAPNITVGSYMNADHYIRTHLDLLKEDFEIRLRAGIALYLEDPRARNHDIWVYKNVIVDLAESEEYMYKIQLCSDFLSEIQWEKSSRFLHGSMVLITNQIFSVFHVAIVRDRGNVEGKKIPGDKYYVCVEFLMAPPRYNQSDRYILIEPTTFFEPYHQVMMALASFYKTGLPMERYLVDVDTSACLPKYIDDSSQYVIDQAVVSLSKGTGWPNADTMGLNESQRTAIMNALTNELVLIQGPPGTGKTHLAFKLIKYLIDNNKFASPILVVCYKNHSLDQILEGLHDRGLRLLRVGAQSKSEKLKDSNLSKVVTAKVNYIFKQIKDNEDLTKKLSQELNILWNSVNLLKTKRGIVHLGLFKKFEVIPLEVLKWFKDDDVYFEWLLASNSFLDDSLPYPTTDHIAAMSQFDCSPTLVYGISLDVILNEIEALKLKRQELVAASKNKPLNRKQQNSLHNCMDQLETGLFNFNMVRARLDEFGKVKASESTVHTLMSTKHLNNLPLEDRWKIYRFWESRLMEINEIQLEQAMNERFSLNEEHRELRDMFKCRQIESYCPDVLGITTSGAAAHHRILEQIAPPVVVVEEAAEVLESHIVASISKSCQHLILIGDHEQLKPSTASHFMASNFQMDVSLFERMMKNNARFDTLNVQHRMRPEIAALICPSIYPNLVNHPSVCAYPDVPGVTKNLLFFQHLRPEEVPPDSESRFNRFEADFALALCSYLTKQEVYKKNPGRITILTTYKEQERYIMKGQLRLKLDLPGVLITAVDNYQGEENDVIILSLVRSNFEGNVGFLATKNRICVALSRARHGLYILGNLECLVKKKTSIWCTISDVLQSQDAIVADIPLKCAIHGSVTLVRDVEQFLSLKNGGCPQKCQMQLDCGHVCPRHCHGYDTLHENEFKCRAPCLKKCPMGHSCTEVCSVECPPCQVPVAKILPCTHTEDVPCSETPHNDHCRQHIFINFDDCGHQLLSLCRERFNAKCNTMCDADLACGHKCPKICHVDEDRFHESFKCMEQCIRFNPSCPVIHECTRLCHEDCGPCLFLVSKLLPCTHTKKIECSKDIDGIVCNKLCKKNLRSCGHICPNECWKPCGPCKMQVDYTKSCGHQGQKICGLPGAESNDCIENCTRVKDCGHVCSGPCNQDCNNVKCEVRVDLRITCGHVIHVKCYRTKASTDVMLGWCKEPCREILPRCGHRCQGTCGLCLQGRVHKGCTVVCNKPLICFHQCSAPCGHLYHTCNRKECETSCWSSSSDVSIKLEAMSIKKGRQFSYVKHAFDKLNTTFWTYFKKNSPGGNEGDYIERGALAEFASRVSVSASNLRVQKNHNLVPLMVHFFLVEFVNVARNTLQVTNEKPGFSSVTDFLEALIESLQKRDLHHLTFDEIFQFVAQMTLLKICVVTPSRYWTPGKSMFELWNDENFYPKTVSSDERLTKSSFPMTIENVIPIIHHSD